MDGKSIFNKGFKMFKLILLGFITCIFGNHYAFGQNQKASTQGATIPAGVMMPYAGTTAPLGWVFAAGQEYNTTGTYAKLFAAIGTTYCTNDHGAGGTCTAGVFRLPDLRGRFVGGKDNMNGIAANRVTVAKTLDGTILGKAGGNQSYTPAGSIPASGLTFSGSLASYSVSVPGHQHGVGGIGNHSHSSSNIITGTQQFAVAAGGSATVASCFGGSCSDVGSNINAHGHSGYVGLNGGASGDGAFTASGSNTPAGSIAGSATLGGTEGNNLSPTIILNYIMKI